MSAHTQAPTLSTLFRVGHWHLCEISFGRSGLTYKWTPSKPSNISDDDYDVYIERQEAFLGEIAAFLGRPIGFADNDAEQIRYIKPKHLYVEGRA